jgi:hypothetical protein
MKISWTHNNPGENSSTINSRNQSETFHVKNSARVSHDINNTTTVTKGQAYNIYQVNDANVLRMWRIEY